MLSCYRFCWNVCCFLQKQEKIREHLLPMLKNNLRCYTNVHYIVETGWVNSFDFLFFYFLTTKCSFMYRYVMSLWTRTSEVLVFSLNIWWQQHILHVRSVFTVLSVPHLWSFIPINTREGSAQRDIIPVGNLQQMCLRGVKINWEKRGRSR